MTEHTGQAGDPGAATIAPDELSLACPHCRVRRILDRQTVEDLERELYLWDNRFDSPLTILKSVLEVLS